jgi:hypothetical protein
VPTSGPVRRANTKTTTGPAEVIGLASAQAYVAQMTSACTAAAEQARRLADALAGHSVAGAAVAAIKRAYDLTAQAGSAWAQVGAALDRQITVKEAYAVAPQAGSKTFLTDDASAVGAERRPANTSDEPVAEGAEDRLRLVGRVKLGPGETVLSSRYLSGGGQEDQICLMLVVQTPAGPRARLGVGIPAADRAAWRGADLGATVVLDAAAVGQLQQQLPQLHNTARQAQDELARRAQDEESCLLDRLGYESARYPQINPAELVFAQQGRDNALREAKKLRDRLQHEVVAKLTDDERKRWAAFDDHISQSTGAARWHLMLEQLAIARGLTRKQFDRFLELDDRYARRDITGEERRERDALLAAPGGLPQGAERRDVVFVLSELNNTLIRAEDRQRKVAELTANPVPLDADTQAELREAVKAHELASGRLNEMPEAVGQITVPGQWGDLVVQAVLNDDPDSQPIYHMAVRAPGAGDGWDPVLSSAAYYTSSYRQARRIVTALHDSLGTLGR